MILGEFGAQISCSILGIAYFTSALTLSALDSEIFNVGFCSHIAPCAEMSQCSIDNSSSVAEQDSRTRSRSDKSYRNCQYGRDSCLRQELSSMENIPIARVCVRALATIFPKGPTRGASRTRRDIPEPNQAPRRRPDSSE